MICLSTLELKKTFLLIPIPQPAMIIQNTGVWTRSKSRITKPNPMYTLHTPYSAIPFVPKNIQQALAHEGWNHAMQEELEAIKNNRVWNLIPKTKGMHILRSKWIYKSKLNADGSLQRLKARLVAVGNHQVEGLDFNETFSPIVRPATMKIGLLDN